MSGYYVQRHLSQYDPAFSTITHTSGCTWTSGANGVAAVSGGATAPTPDDVHAKVPSSEETSPQTPGWSLQDLDLALSRIAPGFGFTVRSGSGFAAAAAAAGQGYYLVLQGVSAKFSDATCSGSFNGDHAIGWSPNSRVEADGTRSWWIDDPVCPAGRWEREAVLKAYAEALSPTVYWGYFTKHVPAAGPKLFSVRVRQSTSVYDAVDGKKVGAVSSATWTCSRTAQGSGSYWYKILGPARSHWVGRWTPAEPWMEVTPL